MSSGEVHIISDKDEKKIDEKRKRMLTEPVEGLVCKMAVPTIISMLVTAFYNLADTYFVGKLDSNSATGAVGLVFSVMAIIQAIGFFFGHGSGNYISRAIGRRDYDSAAKMASTGFFSSLIAGTLLMIAGLLFREPLAYLLGATDTMFHDTVSYLTVILIGTPFIMTSFVLNNQLRLQGNSLFAMAGLLIGAVTNVVLDPIFIFSLQLGVKGAALATIITQFLSFVILFIGCQKSSNVSIYFRNFTPTKEYYGEIAGGGLPSLGRQGLASVATMLLNRYAASYGDAAVAAFSVVSKITNICSSAMIGFGQGFQPVCGFNYGAGRYDRVKRAVWFCVKISAIFLTVLAILMYVVAPEAVALFRDDETVIEIGADILRYQSIALPVQSWIIMMNMYLQNTRQVVLASVLAMCRQGMVFIPVLFIFSSLLGLQGIVLAQPVADIVTFFIAIPIGIYGMRKMSKN